MWSFLSPSNSSAASDFTSRPPPRDNCKQAFGATPPNMRFLTEKKTTARQTALFAGEGGRETAETHEVQHHQHPFRSSLLYSDDKRFFMHEVDTRMEATRSQWRHASCDLEMQQKTEHLFDPIYFTSRYWSQALAYLLKRLCWKCQVILFPPNPRRKTKHKERVAAPEFSLLCLRNQLLPEVYTFCSRECQFSGFETMAEDFWDYSWRDLGSFLLFSQTPVTSITAVHSVHSATLMFFSITRPKSSIA